MAFKQKVFKGLNESTGELFAVKQISLRRGLKEEINTLEAEIDLMKDLDHRYSNSILFWYCYFGIMVLLPLHIKNVGDKVSVRVTTNFFVDGFSHQL